MRIPKPRPRDNAFGAMTPMIDIVFLLLIFFVVSASGQVREMLLPADLPSGQVDSELAEPDPISMTVEVWLKLSTIENGTTVVDMNGTTYQNLDQLKGQLRLLAEVGPDNPVILDIAQSVPLGDVVDIYDTAQSAGFDSISFSAD